VNIIDALCANSVYPQQVSVAFTRLSLPFALSSFLLIILYWHETMTNATIVIHPFVHKMRIPFYLLSGAMLIVQLIQIFLRSFTPIENSVLITGTINSFKIVFFDFRMINRCHVHCRNRRSCNLPHNNRYKVVAQNTPKQTFRTSCYPAKGQKILFFLLFEILTCSFIRLL